MDGLPPPPCFLCSFRNRRPYFARGDVTPSLELMMYGVPPEIGLSFQGLSWESEQCQAGRLS